MCVCSAEHVRNTQTPKHWQLVMFDILDIDVVKIEMFSNVIYLIEFSSNLCRTPSRFQHIWYISTTSNGINRHLNKFFSYNWQLIHISIERMITDQFCEQVLIWNDISSTECQQLINERKRNNKLLLSGIQSGGMHKHNLNGGMNYTT